MPHLAERERHASARTTHYLADYKRLNEDAGQRTALPSWLRETREQAIGHFERLGIPTTRLEEWKFTSVAPIAERSFALAMDGASAIGRDQMARLGLGGTPAAVIVCVNGRYSAQLSSIGALPAGAQVSGLASALTANPGALEPHLTQYAPVDRHAFTALNTAFLQDGVFISLPPGTIIDAPIHVCFISTAPDGLDTVSHPRLLIVADENSQAQIVERYLAWPDKAGAACFTNAVTEVALGGNAVVDHYKLLDEGRDMFHVGSMYLQSKRSSTFTSHSLSLGNALVRNEVVAVLDGEGVDCTLNGLYLAAGQQLVDNHTTIDHVKPHCASHEVYKGILAGRARAVFNGKIIVRPDAQKTDAKQTNKALLLSDEAQINTKPQLEIFANDVKCTHGAAVGQLDDDAIFYLRSRGLGYDEARALLIRAFAGDILNRLKVPALRERLESMLAARLPGGGANA